MSSAKCKHSWKRPGGQIAGPHIAGAFVHSSPHDFSVLPFAPAPHLIVCCSPQRNYYHGFVPAKSAAAGWQLSPYIYTETRTTHNSTEGDSHTTTNGQLCLNRNSTSSAFSGLRLFHLVAFIFRLQGRLATLLTLVRLKVVNFRRSMEHHHHPFNTGSTTATTWR